MQAPELAVKEARRCVEELGLAGFQIGSHIEQRTLDDEFSFHLSGARAPWCVPHGSSQDMMGKGLLKDFWLPWLVSMPAETSAAICSFIFGGIFERLQIWGHVRSRGRILSATIGRIQHGFGVPRSLCGGEQGAAYLIPWKILDRSFDSFQDTAQYVIDLIGENNMLWDDYPFPLGETYPLKKPAELIDSLKTAPSVEKLLGMDAIMWLFGQGTRRPILSENGMRMLKMFRSSPHRSSKIGEKLIIAKFDESSVGSTSAAMPCCILEKMGNSHAEQQA